MNNKMEYKTAGTLTQAGAPSIEELKQINAFTRTRIFPGGNLLFQCGVM